MRKGSTMAKRNDNTKRGRRFSNAGANIARRRSISAGARFAIMGVLGAHLRPSWSIPGTFRGLSRHYRPPTGIQEGPQQYKHNPVAPPRIRPQSM